MRMPNVIAKAGPRPVHVETPQRSRKSCAAQPRRLTRLLGSVFGADEARDANGLLRGISPHCDQCDVHLAVWVRVKAELGLSQRRLPSEKAEVARLKGKVLEVALKECRIIGTQRTHGQDSAVWKPDVLSVAGAVSALGLGDHGVPQRTTRTCLARSDPTWDFAGWERPLAALRDSARIHRRQPDCVSCPSPF